MKFEMDTSPDHMCVQGYNQSGVGFKIVKVLKPWKMSTSVTFHNRILLQGVRGGVCVCVCGGGGGGEGGGWSKTFERLSLVAAIEPVLSSIALHTQASSISLLLMYVVAILEYQ